MTDRIWLVICAETDMLAWRCASLMLGLLNMYARQLNIRNTQLLVTTTERDQEKERTETLFQDLVTKPWRPSIAHWRGSCDQDASTGTKQTSRGNGNWLSPLSSLPSSNISFTPLTFAHTPFPPLTFHSLLSHLLTPILIFSHTTRIPQHFYLTHSHSILTQIFHITLYTHTEISHYTDI